MFLPQGEHILLRGLFMEKKLFVGAVVLLGVSLFFAGCEPETEYVSDGNGPGAGYVATATELTTALSAGKSPIAVIEAIALPGNVTIPANVKVELYASLTLNAGAVLTVTGELILKKATVGSLVLTGAASGGAKIVGTGKVKAGKTEIVGGTVGWQAVASDSSTVTVAVTDANTATITASSGNVVLTAQGANATITQLAGANNGLTIEANTVIDFKTAASGGSLVLAKAADTHLAKITLAADSAKLLLGTGAAGTQGVTAANLTTALATVGVTTESSSNLTGKAANTGANQALTQIIGASNNNTLSGPASSSPLSGEISSVLTATGGGT
jgi:hypothetical protein